MCNASVSHLIKLEKQGCFFSLACPVAVGSSCFHSHVMFTHAFYFLSSRGVTVVCLNCDFLTDGSGLDRMATHLSESHTHACQVIIENGEYV